MLIIYSIRQIEVTRYQKITKVSIHHNHNHETANCTYYGVIMIKSKFAQLKETHQVHLIMNMTKLLLKNHKKMYPVSIKYLNIHAS